ncbi:MAG: hypothetical protein LBC96_01660 [Lachnospiraceae bacterium]|jgi:hypothetical protein|nr:hypothetical protein [Lachnospiraceae bacterium]
MGIYDFSIDAYMTDLVERHGMIALFLPLLVVIVAAIIYFIIVVKLYGGYLRRKYKFRIFANIPSLFTLVCYMLFFAVVFDDLPDKESIETLYLVIAVGLPGMLWYTINSFIKTRNFFITVLNFVIMYIFFLALGWIASAVAMLILYGIGLMIAMWAVFSPDYYICSTCENKTRYLPKKCSKCGELLS